jgi:hypothetical protein
MTDASFALPDHEAKAVAAYLRREAVEDDPADDIAEPEPAARADNRQAWLSDVDALILYERKFITGVVGEVIGEHGADVEASLRKEFDAKLGALKLENLDLRALIADVAHELATLRATRGVTDGQSLPAGLTRPAPKRSRAGRAAGLAGEAAQPR